MSNHVIQLSEQELNTLVQNTVNTTLHAYTTQRMPAPPQQMLPAVTQNAPYQYQNQYPSDLYSLVSLMMMMNYQQQRQYQAQIQQQQQQFQRMMQIMAMNQKHHRGTSQKICDVLSAGGTFLSKII